MVHERNMKHKPPVKSAEEYEREIAELKQTAFEHEVWAEDNKVDQEWVKLGYKFHYPNMCRDGHGEVGHSETTGCPVCELLW